MLRRSFLVWAGASGVVAAGSVAGFHRWQEITPTVHYPGRAEGHFLRDRRALPPPSKVIHTDIAILGSGVAGLTAAWKLKKLGRTDVLMIDGPQPHGNAAGGAFGDLEYPTGAHYLPLPSPESVHVREILADLGIIQKDAMAEKPYYDERYILHGPEERLLFNGHWQDGFIPTDGVPQWERDEHTRFFAEVTRLRQTHGADGRRVFVFPTVMSSEDPQWQALDRITLKQWLEQNGYKSPTLHWYLNYCCRDDYGTRYDQVSAWAGLHYYCSRWGQAANAGNGAWLTWPGGLQPLASGIERASGVQRMAGTAVSLKTTADGVEALCFKLENGQPSSYIVRARKAICAMPTYVAARVVENIAAYGFDPAQHVPQYAPWMVANFLLKRFPDERPSQPLSWDNVVYSEPGLGFVVSTHQDIRVQPPEKTVFSAYVALSDRKPGAARRWMEAATPEELLALASADLKEAYGSQFASCVERVDITLRGHAMASPGPNFRSNAGMKALREVDGPILFAHADLSGFSVFEEAAWWGCRAATLAAK
ncbi:FAD-binding protein [Duganella sp. BJB488]|uniref:NAD(P)-binding protein n=1 Tax=unclassified Duganella TaxID=2636909 RepID=UPI000E3554B7|nr:MULTISPECIES: NAD(P)-binding protein [unclassified Duganella]RFP24415.1 FAD-binding protein [Duganella sp. BJB489]RFP26775.1 FAD-binding protein [Duganella sp. BJB488]RFP34492.1 FAD-binding protein [Duganella sp. BJB480]